MQFDVPILNIDPRLTNPLSPTRQATPSPRIRPNPRVFISTSILTLHHNHQTLPAANPEPNVMPIDENTPLLLPTTATTTPGNSHTHEAQLTTQSRPRTSSTMSASTFWKVGAIYGAAAVGLGAFGAHGLKKRISDPQKIASWGTAAQYQVR